MGLGIQGPICMSTGRDQENPQLARTLNSRIKTFTRQAGETRPSTAVGGLTREALGLRRWLRGRGGQRDPGSQHQDAMGFVP